MTAETAPEPTTVPLDLRQDVAVLTAALMDINSVSGNEKELADAVDVALRAIPQLRVVRDGDSIIARTELGLPERVILAGHLDTVPLPTTENARGTVPSTWESGVPGEGVLYGRGATDMKGGVAVQLALAARDVEGREADHEHAGERSLDQELDLQRDEMRRLGFTHDYREGVAAFLAKRPAKFIGR